MDNSITLFLVGRTEEEAKEGFLWSEYIDAARYKEDEFAEFEEAEIWTVTATFDLNSIEPFNRY